MNMMDQKAVKTPDGWVCRYGLTKVPRWQYGHGGASPVNLPVKGADGNTDPVTWSAPFEPPAIGDWVRVSVNGIGRGTVVGYFVEYGWLGVCVQPFDPPEWYVKQNGKGAVCGVMGAELKSR
jgi:hypothetical protein